MFWLTATSTYLHSSVSGHNVELAPLGVCEGLFRLLEQQEMQTGQI